MGTSRPKEKQRTMGKEKGSEQKTIDTIRRKTRRRHTAEEKIRIMMEGLKG